MSVAALKGARAVTPKLRQMIAALPTEDPARQDRRARRPHWMAAALVHLVLADRHRMGRDGGRGCATESVGQLAEVTGLSEQVVRRCLDALHEVGVWTRGRRGGPGRATERIPMFLPDDSAPPEGAQSFRTSNPDSAPPAGTENSAPIGENSAPIDIDSAPIGENSAPPEGATPPTTTTDHTTTSSSTRIDDDELIVRAHMDAHLAWNDLDISRPPAFREAVTPRMREVVQTARSLGQDPRAALENEWQTKPLAGQSIDLASGGTGFRSVAERIANRSAFEHVDSTDPHAGPTVRVIEETPT